MRLKTLVVNAIIIMSKENVMNNTHRMKKRTPKPRQKKLTEEEKFLNKIFNKKNCNYSWGKPKLFQNILLRDSEGKTFPIYSFENEFYLHEFFCLNTHRRDGSLLPKRKGVVGFFREDIPMLLDLIILNFTYSETYPLMIFNNVKDLASILSCIDPEPDRENMVNMLSLVRQADADKEILYLYSIL
jgi:hypothetical protein